MIVLVKLERDKGPVVDALVRKLNKSGAVMDIWYVTGDHDLVLHVAAQDMAAYDFFTRRTLHADGHVHSFELSSCYSSRSGQPLLALLRLESV